MVKWPRQRVLRR